MELEQFVIQQWVKRDLLYLCRITTQTNYIDTMKKQLGRTKFHQHFNYIMGRLPVYNITEPFCDHTEPVTL